MDTDGLIARLPDLLRRGWAVEPVALDRLTGGMNSAVALVDLPAGRFVAKWVGGVGVLDRGSAIAARLAGHGLITGPPLPTVDGALSLRVEDASVALLHHVNGAPLTGSADDQRAMASVLARVHGCDHEVRRGAFLRDWWSDPAPEPTWLAAVLADILGRYEALAPIGWGIVHADPAPEAFLRLSSGAVGLIDWTGAATAPVLYDVASALMYLGGRDRSEPFLRTYGELGPVPAAELDDHLELFGLIRAGVQAAYFARRLATDDRTGIDDPAENVKGFTDAQGMLAQHGVDTPAYGAS